MLVTGAIGVGRTLVNRRGPPEASKSGSFMRLGGGSGRLSRVSILGTADTAAPVLRERVAVGCWRMLPDRGFPGKALDLLVGLLEFPVPLRSEGGATGFLAPRRLAAGVGNLGVSSIALISGGICTWCTILTARHTKTGMLVNSVCIGGLQQPGQPKLLPGLAFGSERAN